MDERWDSAAHHATEAGRALLGDVREGMTEARETIAQHPRTSLLLALGAGLVLSQEPGRRLGTLLLGVALRSLAFSVGGRLLGQILPENEKEGGGAPPGARSRRDTASAAGGPARAASGPGALSD